MCATADEFGGLIPCGGFVLSAVMAQDLPRTAWIALQQTEPEEIPPEDVTRLHHRDSREDPPLPLARSRARVQLTKVRGSDLRFSFSEAAEFLKQVMDLTLSAEDIAALERRTEGWIAAPQQTSSLCDAVRFGCVETPTGQDNGRLDFGTGERIFQGQPEWLARES